MAYVRGFMSAGIPTPTHQVEVHKYADDTDDPWEPGPPYDPAFVLVNAVIEPLPGSVENGADTQAINRFRLIADPCVIDHKYVIVDPVTTWAYEVVWVAQVADPIRGIEAFAGGFGHVEGELQRVEGLPGARKARAKKEGEGVDIRS